jgi:hypothetical protein
MAYVGTNGRVYNSPIATGGNLIANVVTELIADITAGIQVLLGQR